MAVKAATKRPLTDVQITKWQDAKPRHHHGQFDVASMEDTDTSTKYSVINVQ